MGEKVRRASPLKEKAIAYLNKSGVVSANKLMEDVGVSRATAFNILREFKTLDKSVVKVEVPKTKPKPKKDKAEPVKASISKKFNKKKKFGTIPKTSVPKELKNVPGFGVEGFAVKMNTTFSPSVMTWTNRVYLGLCPSCGNKIAHIKRMVGSDIEYSGICEYCDIRSTISRDK